MTASKRYGDIPDGRGNTIRANLVQWTLHRRGWRIVEIKKRGMFKLILWYKSGVGTYTQETALQLSKPLKHEGER